MDLYHPALPLAGSSPFLVLPVPKMFRLEYRKQMESTARKVFLILEKAWQLLGRRLADFKVEFGFNKRGDILLADVIDNDSWRLIFDGNYQDKQIYRDGGALDDVTAKYKLVRDLTYRFAVPKQAVILWQGSPDDKPDPFFEEFNKYRGPYFDIILHVQESAHKKPVHVYQRLARLTQEYPESVIIADVGLSNGLGPILAANCSVPVIAVPQKIKIAALRESLNAKLADKNLMCVDQLKATSDKTKDFAKVLTKLKLKGGTILALLDGNDEKISRVSRNIPFFSLMRAEDVNAYHILENKKILITKSAFNNLLKRLK